MKLKTWQQIAIGAALAAFLAAIIMLAITTSYTYTAPLVG